MSERSRQELVKFLDHYAGCCRGELARSSFGTMLHITPTDAEAIQQAADAMRVGQRDWRGVLDLPRVRVIGSAGLNDPKSNYAFVTVELWTQHEAKTTPEAVATLERFFAKAAPTSQETPVPHVDREIERLTSVVTSLQNECERLMTELEQQKVHAPDTNVPLTESETLLQAWADLLPPNGKLYWYHVHKAREYFKNRAAPVAKTCPHVSDGEERVLNAIDTSKRLKKLSNQELVSIALGETTRSTAALVLHEMCSRLHPGWENDVPEKDQS